MFGRIKGVPKLTNDYKTNKNARKYGKNATGIVPINSLQMAREGLAGNARRALLCAEISVFLALFKPYFSPFFSRPSPGTQENGNLCGIRLFLPIPIGAFSESFHAKNLTKPEVIC